jgi:hypothetical protein
MPSPQQLGKHIIKKFVRLFVRLTLVLTGSACTSSDRTLCSTYHPFITAFLVRITTSEIMQIVWLFMYTVSHTLLCHIVCNKDPPSPALRRGHRPRRTQGRRQAPRRCSPRASDARLEGTRACRSRRIGSPLGSSPETEGAQSDAEVGHSDTLPLLTPGSVLGTQRVIHYSFISPEGKKQKGGSVLA